MRMLATLLAGPRAYSTRRTVRALARRGMLELCTDGRIQLSRWGRIKAEQCKRHPDVRGWVPGAIMGGN